MPTVALVTCRDIPDLTEDDRLLLPELASAGIEGRAAVWDDPHTRWDSFDAVVIRSTWDYVPHWARFLDWIGLLEDEGARVWNPPAVLRWNIDKAYLAELERAGIDVVPTAWLHRGADVELAAVLADSGWDRAVVKPGVSAGGHRTWTTTRAEAASQQGELDALLADGDVLVQPFLEEVVEEGEWSIVFFGGRFSHAILKRPASGDFRVQEKFGGVAEAADPGAGLVERAAEILTHVPGDLLYARVDGVAGEAGFRLIELEVLEPSLFLGQVPDAARRLVEELVARI